MTPSDTDTDIELVPTGISAFDDMLGGGIPQGHIVLLAGDSGTGKTLLSLEWLFHGYRDHGAPGLYLTLTEPITQAVKHVRRMDFYDEAAFEQEDIHFTDLRTTIDLLDLQEDATKDDVEKVIDAIEQMVQETGAKRVVLDSITALAYMLNDKELIRYFIFRLGALLDSLDCTTFMTSEVGDSGYSVYGVEEFISDGIIKLRQEPMNHDLRRSLQIIKMRGLEYDSEQATFSISRAGITIFNTHVSPTYTSPGNRISLGVSGLDELCGGGVFDTSTTMVSGPAGTGKTLISMHFLAQGLENGEKCLLVTFEESVDQLTRNAQHFGWDLGSAIDRGDLIVISRYPEEQFPEEHLHSLKRAVEEHDVDRAAIDPLSAIGNAYPEDDYVRYARNTIGYLKQNDVLSLVTASTPTLMGTHELSKTNLSTLSDNVILLKYAETTGRLSRILTVLKTRGTGHKDNLYQYNITEKGMQIHDPVMAFEGVLSGSARKVDKTVAEQIRELFLHYLGPMGKTEFDQLEHGQLTRTRLLDYINNLSENNLITAEEAARFKEDVHRVFGGEIPRKPSYSGTDIKQGKQSFLSRILG